MRFAINIEFTNEELKHHAADVLRRVVTDLVNDMGGTIGKHPEVIATVMGMIASQIMSKAQAGADNAASKPPFVPDPPPAPETDPS